MGGMTLRSPHVDVAIPDVPIAEHVLARAAVHPERMALIDADDGGGLSYGELAEAVAGAALALQRRGFARGDVLAIVAANCPAYAVALYGASSLGGVVTAANPLYRKEELTRQLEDCGARWIVADRAREALAREVAAAVPTVHAVHVLEELGSQRACPRVRSMSPSATDVALLPYSGGTGGLPKGVMLSHRNLVANIVQLSALAPFADHESVVATLPFFHITGIQLLLNLSLANGATVVTMSRFEVESFLAVIERHEVTRAFIVPPIALRLVKDPAVRRYRLDSLRALYCGAAPLGAELGRACAQRLGCHVLHGYGLTETAPVVAQLREADVPHHDGSVGPPVAGTEIRIEDPAGSGEVPDGEAGEICVRGPQVMLGYLNRPDETAAAIDADGWLRTGDLGFIDSRGRIHVVDRLKEIIKFRAFQVAPAELEALLIEHPMVIDAAVLPSPDPEAGEIPKALVVTSGEVDPDTLVEYVARRTAPYKRLRRIEFADAIPRSAAGKILRRELIERERARGGR